MKSWFLPIVVFITFAFQQCAVSNARLFQSIKSTDDKTYGYTQENPVEIKNAGLETSIDASYYYLSRLRTASGEKLTILKRKSTPVPGYKENPLQPYNRQTGQPIGGGGEILDHYTLVTESGKDTISLYLNAYRKGEVKIPTGLAFEAEK